MTSFFEWVFNHNHYTTGCTIAAFFLFAYSVKSKFVPMSILLFEFSMCKLSSVIGLTLTSLLDNSGLYLVYAIIQVLAILCFYLLARKGSDVPMLIVVSISLAAIYNTLMIAPYYGYAVFGFSGQEMYNEYSNILGSIMFMQLIYMASYNKLLISKLGKYARTYTLFIDWLYISYRRNNRGGLA